MSSDDARRRDRESLWRDPSDAEQTWLQQPADEPAAAAPQPEPPAPRRRRRGRVLALLAAIVIVALGGFTAGRELSGGSSEPNQVGLPTIATGDNAPSRAKQVYDQVKGSIVQVRVGRASGSGFVINSNGTIVTNQHVVDGGGGQDVSIVIGDGKRTVPAKVLGEDVSSDLAVLKVDPAAAGNPKALALADSDAVSTGEEVLAVGYPLGLDQTATTGIVSGVGRQIQAPNGFSIDKVIQTDASINQGNSGGPLLDSRGRVIGVNSQIAATAVGGNTGIGFAVPSNTVTEVVKAIASGGKVERPYLGASLTEPERGDGALVAEIVPNGPADEAGMRGGETTGDLITAIDGKGVGGPDELISELNGKAVGDTVTLTVKRAGRSRDVEVTLGTRPSVAPSRAQSPTGP